MIRLSAFADEIAADPAEQLDVLAAHGIGFVEFRSIHKINVLDLSEAQHQEFRAMLRARGFGLSAIGSPIGKIAIGDPFEPHLERFEIALRLAEFYEVPRVRIFSYYLPKEDDPATYRDEVLRRMTTKARIARDRGIALVLENERHIYGDTAARVLDVLESVGSPALAHAFDPANYLEVGQDVSQAWALLRHHVTHFHVKDYDLTTRVNVVAGTGQGRIPELIADAVARGYQGFCTLEPHLVESHLTHGFTGPVRFADAANGLKSELQTRAIEFA